MNVHARPRPARNQPAPPRRRDHRGGGARVCRARLPRRHHAGHRRRARHPPGEPLLLFLLQGGRARTGLHARASRASSRPRRPSPPGPERRARSLTCLIKSHLSPLHRPRRFRQGVPQRAPASAGRKPPPRRPLVARARAHLRGRHQGGRGARESSAPISIRAWPRSPSSACAMRYRAGSARKTPPSTEIGAEFARLVAGRRGQALAQTRRRRPTRRLPIGSHPIEFD